MRQRSLRQGSMRRRPVCCLTFLSARFSFNDFPGFLLLGFCGDLSGMVHPSGVVVTVGQPYAHRRSACRHLALERRPLLGTKCTKVRRRGSDTGQAREGDATQRAQRPRQITRSGCWRAELNIRSEGSTP